MSIRRGILEMGSIVGEKFIEMLRDIRGHVRLEHIDLCAMHAQADFHFLANKPPAPLSLLVLFKIMT